jgi:hypothetical protein
MPTYERGPSHIAQPRELAAKATEMLDAAAEVRGVDAAEAQTVALIGIGYALLAVRAELALFD